MPGWQGKGPQHAQSTKSKKYNFQIDARAEKILRQSHGCPRCSNGQSTLLC